MQKWQQSYQVKAPMHLGTFLLAGGLSLLLALITISALTLRAATANPINALKDE
jgi:putative ABC transport system permease protein